MFVLNYWLREFLLSEIADHIELRCGSEQLMPLYTKSALVTVIFFIVSQFSHKIFQNDRFGVTMNIKKAWSKGYTGKNVTICINDPSGIEYKHGDLLPRFVCIHWYILFSYYNYLQ